MEKEPEKFVNQDMVKKIESIEDEMLGKDKKWQMKGEVKSSDRPVNSLLQEHLDFKMQKKLAP